MRSTLFYMARRRFFVDLIQNGKAELFGEDAHHLARVLRAQVQQQFELSDNQAVYLAEVRDVRQDRVAFAILEELLPRPEPVGLTLCVALIKFDRFEWIVEKGTELGVGRFVPVAAGRSEKGLEQAARKRLERWRRIAREASGQSHRDRLPEILAPAAFDDALARAGTLRFFLDESGHGRPILDHVPPLERRLSSDSIVLLSGPEGGWTDEERAGAVAAGWLPVTLGPRILRAETAALAAVSVLGLAWSQRPWPE